MKVSNPDKITKHIKKKALSLGFDLVGITTAEPLIKAKKRLKNRKLSNFIKHNTELLTEPKLHLPGARSIISLALSYAHSSSAETEYYIAKYARGKDYHLIMKKMFKKLEQYIKELVPDAACKSYVDTGPILEREIAMRAGLGWIGKNNNLINPQYGSYLFLGEIITNLELEYDKPMKARCGSCNLCLKNCPGKALKAPYELEPELCISYLTQKRGILTEEERKIIGNNLWGCDNCQLVCPYNHDIPDNIHYQLKPHLKDSFTKILSFNKKNIKKEWLEAPLSWRGIRILKRNALINIGNIADDKYIPLLLELLEHPSYILRMYAVWALGQIGNKEVVTELKNLYKKEKDLRVKQEIEEVFNNWGVLDDKG